MGVKFGDWFVAVHQDVGRTRPHQEDFATVVTEGSDLLLLVCDGMGGHAAGDVASARAGSIVERHFRAALRDRDDDIPQSLWSALVEANDVIRRDAEAPSKKGMGTTAVIGWLRGPEVWVAHVGDSRLLHLRDGVIAFRTKDHTKVQKMVDAGILTPEQAARHDDANVVQRALGHMPAGGEDAEKRPEVRSEPLRAQRGDAILLCSDGLYDLVSDAEIAALLSQRTAEGAAHALVDLANERGGTDNISVAIAICGSEQVSWTTAPIPRVRPEHATLPDFTGLMPPAAGASAPLGAVPVAHAVAEPIPSAIGAVRAVAPAAQTAAAGGPPWKWIALAASAIAALALIALVAVVVMRPAAPAPAAVKAPPSKPAAAATNPAPAATVPAPAPNAAQPNGAMQPPNAAQPSGAGANPAPALPAAGAVPAGKAVGSSTGSTAEPAATNSAAAAATGAGGSAAAGGGSAVAKPALPAPNAINAASASGSSRLRPISKLPQRASAKKAPAK